MENFMSAKGFIASVIASIVASLLVGTIAYLYRGQTYRQRVDAAPRIFIEKLDELIERAGEEGEAEAHINARAIVSMRNSFRRHTLALSALLNDQITVLEKQIHPGEGVISVTREPGQPTQERASNEELYETIRVLERTWKAKKDELELEIRILLTVLGLDRA